MHIFSLNTRSIQNYFGFFLFFISIVGFSACSHSQNNDNMNNPYYSRTDTQHLNVTNEEWKEILSSDVYYVAREKGTERAFSGQYWDTESNGKYFCAVCGNYLFDSEGKFASTCGWPSFFEPARTDAMIYKDDFTHGMSRIEVMCGRCESHLGHIFEDGPPPTGKRFCINSMVINFEPFQILEPGK